MSDVIVDLRPHEGSKLCFPVGWSETVGSVDCSSWVPSVGQEPFRLRPDFELPDLPLWDRKLPSLLERSMTRRAQADLPHTLIVWLESLEIPLLLLELASSTLLFVGLRLLPRLLSLIS